MSAANVVHVRAVVTANEQAIVEVAATQLAKALSQAAGRDWEIKRDFAPDLAALGDATGSIVLTSLLVPLERLETPWAEIEQDLRAAYATLGETGSPVMICTALRHVPAGDDPEKADRTRLRLRRLNLLATELSREYGALVIDLDRILADIGAQRLGTDYRLGGSPVVEVAGNAIAVSIATNALDDFAAFEIQDAARVILENYRPALGTAQPLNLSDVLALGHGRRKQRVATLTDTVQENHVGWLVRQVLKGQIGPAEAMNKLLQAVRNRGARESAALLATSLVRLIKRGA